MRKKAPNIVGTKEDAIVFKEELEHIVEVEVLY